jgi:hypothetical protein
VSRSPQEQVIDDAEHDNVRTDSEGETRDRSARDGGTPRKAPEGISQILEQDIHDGLPLVVSEFRERP